MTVQLITGATTKICNISEVTCNLFQTQETDNPINNKNIEHKIANMKENRCCNFSVLFTKGTRKQPIKLYYSVKVQVQHNQGQQIFTVNSHPSESLVVITNEVQWSEAEGELLTNFLFTSQNKFVSFAQISNLLQSRILFATKQDFSDIKRPLSFLELKYISSRFFNGISNIQLDNWNSFWEW